MPTIPNCGMGGSTLTVGELRHALEGMDPDLPVTVALELGSEWVNIREVILDCVCVHCGRGIEWSVEAGLWVDPEATGDDIVWRETCEANETFTGYHAPPSLILDTSNDFDTRQF